jgi:hypothetical protein
MTARVDLTDLESVYAWLEQEPDVAEVTAELRSIRQLRQQMDIASGALAAYALSRLGPPEDDQPTGDQPDEVGGPSSS